MGSQHEKSVLHASPTLGPSLPKLKQFTFFFFHLNIARKSLVQLQSLVIPAIILAYVIYLHILNNTKQLCFNVASLCTIAFSLEVNSGQQVSCLQTPCSWCTPALVSRVWKVTTLALITLHHRDLSFRVHCSHIVTTLSWTLGLCCRPGQLALAGVMCWLFQPSLKAEGCWGNR